jgi:hypothetical protein
MRHHRRFVHIAADRRSGRRDPTSASASTAARRRLRSLRSRSGCLRRSLRLLRLCAATLTLGLLRHQE